MKNTAVFVLIAAMIVALLGGCGGSPYPEPTVSTAVGRPGVCEGCGKRISMVGEQEYPRIGSSRFVVCDETCRNKLQEALQGQ